MIRDALGAHLQKEMITIIEVMGRNAGWLTGATALAKTENAKVRILFICRKCRFDIDAFLSKIKRSAQREKSIIVAVSEGIKLPDGRYVCELSGGGRLCGCIRTQAADRKRPHIWRISWEQRSDARQGAVEFSTLQRSASHMASRVDINEAFMVGGAAVKAADEGETAARWSLLTAYPTIHYMEARLAFDDVHKIANNEKNGSEHGSTEQQIM